MANNLQSSVSGLDSVIQSMQKDLYASLDAKYNFEVNGYSRVHRNPKGNGFLPELWNETEQQYKEMYLDVESGLTFFFIDGDTHNTEDGNYFTCPLKVVFLYDLSNLSTVIRADAQAEKDAVSAIHNDTYENFEFQSIEKGVPTVFSGFDISQIQFSNMQPYHVFAVTGAIGYYLNTNC